MQSTRRIANFECSGCRKILPNNFSGYVCDSCGSNLWVNIQFPDNITIREEFPNIWRYADLLALTDYQLDHFHEKSPHAFSVGGTPMFEYEKVATELNVKNFFVKFDGCNPSGSLKDRASHFIVERLAECPDMLIATASTGNAGAALSCCSAPSPVNSLIFAPAAAPAAKLAQILMYGSQLVAVEGTYDDAYILCDKLCKTYGWYNRSTGYNAFTTEGKKTVSFEIAEQLAKGSTSTFSAPDVVVVSVGDGNIISGVYKGFKDLLEAGLIQKMPQICGIQSTNSPAVHECFSKGYNWEQIRDLPPMRSDTEADSISAGKPSDCMKAVESVRKSNGDMVLVTDDEILSAIPHLACLTGVYAEPAAACGFAGILKLSESGFLDGKSVVLLATGTGLKDTRRAIVGAEMYEQQDNTLLSGRLQVPKDVEGATQILVDSNIISK
ncbi:hypothetical protein PCE1_000637 [Barthelona sp. PCE]